MTVVATIAVVETEFVLGRVLSDTDVRIELVELAPVESALVPYFWIIETHDPDAFERGYFEVPRGTTVADLAAEAGVSQQAFSGRLQRAQRQVFAWIFPLGE